MAKETVNPILQQIRKLAAPTAALSDQAVILTKLNLGALLLLAVAPLACAGLWAQQMSAAQQQYMTVLWNVKIAPGASVKAVIIGGYFEQEFEGIPAGIPIACRTYFPSLNKDFFFGHEWDSPDDSPYKGKKVAERLKDLTGLPVATFQGKEIGASFVVDGKRGRDFARKQPKATEDPSAEVADVPSQELRAGGDADKRYFSIGPKKDAKPPAEGYGLLIVLPGGDGSADFHPFVKQIYKNALPDRYLAVQPIAIKWDPDQQIVWPTKTNPVAKMKFSTEEFIDAVIEDVAKKYKIDRSKVFSLSWSSSGPAAYAASLREKHDIKGSFIAMSVFNPKFLPPLKTAKNHAYFLYHSPNDRICPYRMAEQAKRSLTDNGAKVRLKTYEGGHGWQGDVYNEIRQGVEWLEKNRWINPSRNRKGAAQTIAPLRLRLHGRGSEGQ